MAGQDFRSELAGLLPYLRRLARSALGSSKPGDQAVMRCLKVLSEGDLGSDLRVSAFKALCTELKDQVRIIMPGSVASNEALIDRGLDRLDPVERILLLLVTLEKFPASLAADIIGLRPEDGNRVLLKARESLRRQRPARVLIIEDEPMIALDLASILESHGHQVLGIARTRSDAIAKAETLRPQLVLADIRLADNSSGMDAVADIMRALGAVPVVFVTAFPERLLTGEHDEPAYMVTKPFDAEMICVAIAQAQATSGVMTQAEPQH